MYEVTCHRVCRESGERDSGRRPSRTHTTSPASRPRSAPESEHTDEGGALQPGEPLENTGWRERLENDNKHTLLTNLITSCCVWWRWWWWWWGVKVWTLTRVVLQVEEGEENNSCTEQEHGEKCTRLCEQTQTSCKHREWDRSLTQRERVRVSDRVSEREIHCCKTDRDRQTVREKNRVTDWETLIRETVRCWMFVHLFLFI